MTTSIEENELNTELQELYLIGKQWLTDLDFFEPEMGFLIKLHKSLVQSPDKADFKERLDKLRDSYEHLKNDISKFINVLGVLVVASEKKIAFSFLADHISLKLKIEKLLNAFQAERKAIFNLSIVDSSFCK
ncbi:hypothetical protein SAMN05421820_101646 [Pedobacter steynii]|uniref:Uncharacterized protein n=1 Tax=Pedobacter steynii TaxID=430522 RepID=A0A1G9KQ40_9SPHI|nr:hypothetical protein [Pedobacter steynii]NQX38615.1 hypothetical protein [Pedobacter steynii]SDL51832.1 hypothetical protein SAMN05421820_101646 [Pedobacter steynii]